MMKNLIYYLAILVFALSACKKNDAGDAQAPQQNQSKKTEALILNFKDKIENHLKDGGTYTADSAVWYVEALLNYSYGYATALGCTFEADSASKTFNTDGIDVYTLAQLNDVYEYLEENALENKPEDRYIFCIDVSLEVIGNQSTFSSVSAYAKQILPNYKSTADTSGYWFWGNDLGMCGPDSGLYVGTDAADILETLVNATADYDYFTNLEGGNAHYWTNYTDPNFPFNDPNLLPRRIYAYHDPYGPNEDFCLSPSHISYYSGTNGILYIIRDLTPGNKVFAYCSLFDAVYPSGNVDMHIGGFTYGNPIDRE